MNELQDLRVDTTGEGIRSRLHRLARRHAWDGGLIAAAALCMAFVIDPHVAEQTLPRWISWDAMRRFPLTLLCSGGAATGFLMSLKFVTFRLLRRAGIPTDPHVVWRRFQPALLLSIGSWILLPAPTNLLLPSFAVLSFGLSVAFFLLMAVWPWLLSRYVRWACRARRKPVLSTGCALLVTLFITMLFWTVLAETVYDHAIRPIGVSDR